MQIHRRPPTRRQLEVVARLARVLDCLIEQPMPRWDSVPRRANATLAATPGKLKAIVELMLAMLTHDSEHLDELKGLRAELAG